MNKLFGIVSVCLASLATSVASAKEVTVVVPAGNCCFEVLSRVDANPDPAAFPECLKASPAQVSKAVTDANNLDSLRAMAQAGKRAEELAKKIEKRTAALEAHLAMLKAKVAEHDRRLSDHDSDIAALKENQAKTAEVVVRIDGDVKAQKAGLVAQAAVNGRQDQRIAGLESEVEALKSKVTTNRLTLGGKWLLLKGLGGGDTFAGPAAFGRLDLGLSAKTSLNFEFGVAGSADVVGTYFKPSLALDLGGVKAQVGSATYALGLDSKTDATVIVTGMEVGASTKLGQVNIEVNLMPVGVDYATEHDPKYGVGVNAGVSYTF